MQHLGAFLVVVAAACGGSPKPVANTTTHEPAPAGDPVGTLKELQNGDRACYVIVTFGAEERSIEGDFELCKGGPRDATALIGKRVTYKTKKAKVLAASCEGNVDCGKSDDVDLVDTITAAP
jgi:hypothetical protein